MFKHDLPKRIPVGVLPNGRTPLLTINSPSDPITQLFIKRFGDDLSARAADRYLLQRLYGLYEGRAFVRGNLDAGRLNRLFGREIVAAENPFDPRSLSGRLSINIEAGRHSFSGIF